MQFENLGLGDPLLSAIGDAGYASPTPIQAEAIPHLLMGRDIIGIAQTGTGKTAGFTLPMIEILSTGRARARMPRSLILEPTRELAAQVAENFETYGKNHKLSMALLIGGVSFADQDKKLDRGVDVLIATPGRLLDHFERGRVLLADIKILVVDEADRMLDMGFIPDVERIIKLLPVIRQTAMFSATMPPEIKRLTDAYMMGPRTVEVAPQASAAETVIQGLLRVSGGFKEKRAALRRLIRTSDVKNAIVFCNRKRDVSVLEKSLQSHGFNAAGLHGDMHQTARMETLEKFREGEIQLLVASDVAARGLDIIDMSHVFNFDVPIHAEDYIHRIGRTGRAGKQGHAFTLATHDDAKYVDAIERLLGKPIPPVGGGGRAKDGAREGDGADDSAKEKPRASRRGRGARGRKKEPEAAGRGARAEKKEPEAAGRNARDRKKEPEAAGRGARAEKKEPEAAGRGARDRKKEPEAAGRRQKPRESRDRDRPAKPRKDSGKRAAKHGAEDDDAAFGKDEHTPAFLLR